MWSALDKALSEYYQLLVDRQNLIEETGLLNQQNEELKTLLNQYLQAGVNQELQVPPTQVIRLDIWLVDQKTDKQLHSINRSIDTAYTLTLVAD